MLNPSTADGETDDATIRWLIGYAKKHGYGGIIVVNLFAFRATDPKQLLTALDPVGPLNKVYLRSICTDELVLFAWGNGALKVPQVTRMIRVVQQASGKGLCLGRTKLGAPRHPLRMSHDTTLYPY